ncbi:MAG TPA: 3D-(3,5/4)-trihydroxycyclohexane-1,2-dione acylhydrolase (decyclizing) [Chloroflexota bacterium]|jgi:3D-(3,5/4)-trihydroxycyclohexane-1,2-dione acylhydrolase (decyclizing)|nr:3D-(3,5/4)-trihydroxycyclohexane-1,2-dione acylhydrolase (decyclizing) [Chloroflexota bacterium]
MVSTKAEQRAERTDRGAARHLTVAQAIVEYLQVQYSERDGQRRRLIPAIWGIFGHGNVAGLGQALIERGRDLPYYQPFNEQSMVHTAIGYAKANLRLATMACTSSIGPGATNMVTGAATATINRLPVLLLPSDSYATRHQGPVLQQLEHPVSADVSVNDCFRPVSRFFDRISRPEQLLTALPEAMRVLTDPVEAGTVTIALPQDVQAHAHAFPARFFAERTWRVERRPPDPQRIREAVQLLREVERPLIVAGGGVHYAEAWDELKAFAEGCGIPVVETFAGKGAMRDGSSLLLGGGGVTGTAAAGRIARDADLVIAVGTRLTDFTTGSQSAFQHPDVRFVNVNVAPRDAYKQGALPIVADAKLALPALADAARAAGVRPRQAYLDDVRAARAAWEETLRSEVFVRRPTEAMSQGELIGVVNQVARPGDTAIAAAGGLPGDLQKLWDATGGRTLHLEFGYSCMGYELPAGLGVRMAMRQRGQEGEVYVLIGDGTYLMQPSELATAVQEGLKVTIVLSNNHGFQIIRNLQMGRVGRSFGNEFRARDPKTGRLEGAYLPIDFAKNGESFGARVWRVGTAKELQQALEEARAETGSCMIVVETEPHRYLPGSGVWWDVAPAETAEDPTTRSLRQEFEQNRGRLQRLHY